jgi:hypothetical protein
MQHRIHGEFEQIRGIPYVWVQRRSETVFPTREELYSIVPATVETRARHGVPGPTRNGMRPICLQTATSTHHTFSSSTAPFEEILLFQSANECALPSPNTSRFPQQPVSTYTPYRQLAAVLRLTN